MTSPTARLPVRLRTEHYLFAGILLVRLIVLYRLTSSPVLFASRGDMHFYNEWAQRILNGRLTDHLAFYGLPGYAYLLAGIYKLCGYSTFVPGLLQAVVDAGTALLIYNIAVRVFGEIDARAARIASMVAAIGWAFFVPAQTFAVILMPTSWAVFVFWLLVWWVVRNRTWPGKTQALVAGLIAGVTATGIATILFLVPLVAAAIWLRSSAVGARVKVVSLLLLLASLFVGSSPCWIHNYIVAKDRVFLSAHSGVNLWIGNNPAATGYPRFPPGLHAGQSALLQDSIDTAEAAAGHPLKRGEVSAYWSEKATKYIRKNPIAWLRLLLIKTRNFWNAFQYDDLSIITTLREQGVTFPGLYFGVVAALAIPSILLTWKSAPLSRWVAGAIALHMVALLPVFTTERYRLAAAPGLLVFASFGVVRFWEALENGRSRFATAYAALLTLSTVLVSLPQRDPSLWALDAYNTGVQALDSGDLDLARRKFDLAYCYSPLNSEINFAQGNLHLAQGDGTAAKGFYRSTIALNPRHSGAFNNLGILAMKEDRWDVAAAFFRRAIAESPKDAKLYYLLAEARLNSGDPEGACTNIAEAIRLDPAQAEFRSFQHQMQRRQ